MNLLSHYYIAAGNKAAVSGALFPVFALGNVLPDLARMHHKRLLLAEQAGCADDRFLASARQGISVHKKSDRYFHSSAFFANTTWRLKQALIEASFTAPPRFFHFSAHIITEMMIDRHLIREKRLLCDDFYVTLAKVEAAAAEGLVSRLASSRGTAGGFGKFYCRFLEKSYLYGYLYNNSFIFALNKVLGRVGLAGFYGKDAGKLERVMDRFEADCGHLFPETLDELKNRMNESFKLHPFTAAGSFGNGTGPVVQIQ